MKRAILAAVLLVLAGGGGAVYYFLFRSTGPNIGVDFAMPGEVLVGQPFTVSISVSNYSEQVLSRAKIALFVPEGAAFAGQDASQRVMEKAIETDLIQGGLYQKSFEVVVLQDPRSVKRLTARVSYGTGASTATFQMERGQDIVVGQSAASLNLSLPAEVYSGQEFEFAVDYRNNSTQDLRNVRVQLSYPPAFQFAGSSADPSEGNATWNLGTVVRSGSGTFTVRGVLVGPAGTVYSFRGAVEAMLDGERYVITEQGGEMGITASPLALSGSLGGGADYIPGAGDTLTYTLDYRNNSVVPMANVTIRAALVGDMFDFTTLQADGVFDSRTNTLSWNAAARQELGTVAPGTSGSVTFSLRLKNEFAPRRLGDKNYVLKVSGEIESPSVPPGTDAPKTVSLARLEHRVKGKIALAQRVLFRDAASGILNNGPYPPRVNSPTRYTVHWVIKNYATDVSDINLSASLQSGARCTNAIKSTIAAMPVCNPNSGEITWQIGSLTANQGALGQPIEAIIQIEQVPAVNQANQLVNLIGPATLAAKDVFTGAALSAEASGVNTSLPDDPTAGDGRVRQ